MSYYPKQSTDWMKSQIPKTFFCRNRKTHPKIHMESQGTQIAKTILKKNKGGSLTLSHFKIYYKARVITRVWSWHRDRYRPMEYRTQKWILAYMVKWFLTRVLCPLDGERTVFSTTGAGKTGNPHAKEWSWTLI